MATALASRQRFTAIGRAGRDCGADVSATFESELDALARQFLELTDDNIDQGLRDGLRKLARFFGADVAYLALVDDDKTTLGFAHCWARLGCSWSPVAWPSIRLQEYRRLETQLREAAPGGFLQIGNASADFPGIGNVSQTESALLARMGAKSLVTVPLVIKRRCEGYLGIISESEECRWKPGASVLLDNASRVFAAVLERKRTSEELLARAEFSRSLTRLATNLIKLSPGDMDRGIGEALEELGKAGQVERSQIFLFGSDSSVLGNAYEWCAAGMQRAGGPLRDLAAAPFAWALEQLVSGKVIHVSDVSSLGPHATAERIALQKEGIRSFIGVPLVGGEGLIGVLCLTSLSSAKHWSENTIALLRLAAEMFANVFELSRLQTELAHALRLSTMGEMAAGIAHELNQPLTAIRGFASGCERRLRADGDGHEELLDAIEKVSAEAIRAGEVVRRLRAYARKGEPQREWTAMDDLVDDSLSLLRSDAALHGVTLRCDGARTLGKVWIDRVQIEQVILNLLRNGLEAMLCTVEGRRELNVAVRRLSDELRVEVSDTGTGVEQDDLEPLFKPFYTSKREGLGLGLSISRSIIESHGGRLWASKNGGCGLTFTFTLPLAPAQDDDGR